MNTYYFTSESVTEGHPDKICDYISDKILDAYLTEDKNSRVAVETMAINNRIIIAGQVSSNGIVNIENVARNALKEIGYTSIESGLDCEKCQIDVNISKQSSNISNLVENGGAGDQGIMFGYATNETENYMPAPIKYAHDLAKRLADVRKENIVEGLMPDGKTQVTVEYNDGKVKSINTIIISAQHLEDKNLDILRDEIIKEVIFKVIPNNLININTKFLINYRGKFVIGGPMADTGLTGRKIIVDTYGGYARHGGGAFSGKDATKVDRSACYMLRHIAKNIVANGYADKCEIQIAYGIGINEAISLNVNTFGTSKFNEEELLNLIKDKFDLSPKGIIDYLDLTKPIFSKTTNYGHFGKCDLEWERIIKL